MLNLIKTNIHTVNGIQKEDRKTIQLKMISMGMTMMGFT